MEKTRLIARDKLMGVSLKPLKTTCSTTGMRLGALVVASFEPATTTGLLQVVVVAPYPGYAVRYVRVAIIARISRGLGAR